MTDPNKKFGIIYDVRMLNHVCSRPHPESPDRVVAIRKGLEDAGLLKDAVMIPAREVTHEELLRCHTEQYLKKIKNQMIFETLNSGDMFTSDGTYLAAKLAAGSSIELADRMLKDEIQHGFAIIRPPGHHSSCGSCGGFCFFNNAMLAAIHLTDRGKKVYIVDFDLHENDGSTKILNSALHMDNKLLNMFSIHRWDNGKFYPGGESGKSGIDKSGRIVKVGYNGDQGDEYYLSACETHLMPHITAFAPDYVIVSAGFDAALGDPMDAASVTPNGYRAMMEMILSACDRVGMILEGGYGLISAPRSAIACVQALLESK